MKPAVFEVERPTSVDEACARLAQDGREAKVLAGVRAWRRFSIPVWRGARTVLRSGARGHERDRLPGEREPVLARVRRQDEPFLHDPTVEAGRLLRECVRRVEGDVELSCEASSS